jgi:hypothetical protein
VNGHLEVLQYLNEHKHPHAHAPSGS